MMNIEISQLRGRYVYLELLLPDHRDIIRPLARDERIWEFNKMLLIDKNYDKMYDAYFNSALDKQASKMNGLVQKKIITIDGRK